MEKYFNDDQIDYARDLASAPEKVCGCGWYWRHECAQTCHSKDKQRVDDRSKPDQGDIP